MSGISARSILDRLFAFALHRDGQAPMLQQQAMGPGQPEPDPGPAATAARRRRAGPDPQRILLEILAVKTLHAWMQNRHQTLFPLTLNLGVLDPPARALLVRMVAASALAEGREPDAAMRERILQDLARAGAGEEEGRRLAALIAEPEPLPPLLRAVQEAQAGAHAYAASLLAADRHAEAGRAWLDYLAARFALPADVTGGLERRRRWRR